MVPDPHEEALLRAFIAGQPGARDQLLDQWLEPVLRWCVRLGGPRVDAEDAAQEVLLVLLTRVENLEDLRRFQPWLFGVTRRVLAAHRRRAWVRRWVPGARVEGASPRPGPGEELARAELAGLVHAALERLPAGQREVLVLVVMEERTTAEVALLLDLPEGTVKSRLRLARERFRRVAAHLRLTPELALGELQ